VGTESVEFQQILIKITEFVNPALEGITGIATSWIKPEVKHHPLNPVIARSREDQMHLLISHFNTPSEQEFLPSRTSMRNPVALPYAPCNP
jgi:hypothetical protein